MQSFRKILNRPDTQPKPKPNPVEQFKLDENILSLLNTPGKTLDEYKEALVKAFSYLNAVQKMAESYNKIRVYDTVMQCYNVIVLNYEQITKTYFYKKLSNIYFNDGNTNYRLGNSEQVINCYREAIEINKKHIEIYDLLKDVYFAKNMVTKSNEYASKTEDINKVNAEILYNMGNIYYRLGNRETALEHYHDALKLNETAIYFCSRGIVFTELEDTYQAYACFQNAEMLVAQGKYSYTQSPEDSKYVHKILENLNRVISSQEIMLSFSQELTSQVMASNELNDLNADNMPSDEACSFIESSIEEHNAHSRRSISSTKEQLVSCYEEIRKLKEAMQDLLDFKEKQFPEYREARIQSSAEKVTKKQFSDYKTQTDARLIGLEECLNTHVEKIHARFKEIIDNFNNNQKVTMESPLVRDLISDMKTALNFFDEQKKLIEEYGIILSNSGAIETAAINQQFNDLKSDPELYEYAKTFYWTLYEYITSYQFLNSGIVQGQYINSSDASCIVALEIGAKCLTEVLKGIPGVGSVAGCLDSILSGIYKGVKRVEFSKKVESINKVITNKIGINNCELTNCIAKVALELAKKKEDKIKDSSSCKDNELGMDNSWFNNKFQQVKKSLKQEKIQELHPLAVKDVTKLLVYIYENADKIVKDKHPLDTQFTSIILKHKLLLKFVQSSSLDNRDDITQDAHDQVVQKKKDGRLGDESLGNDNIPAITTELKKAAQNEKTELAVKINVQDTTGINNPNPGRYAEDEKEIEEQLELLKHRVHDSVQKNIRLFIGNGAYIEKDAVLDEQTIIAKIIKAVILEHVGSSVNEGNYEKLLVVLDEIIRVLLLDRNLIDDFIDDIIDIPESGSGYSASKVEAYDNEILGYSTDIKDFGN